MDTTITTHPRRDPWNKGKLIGQKAPFKLKDIWALRVRLQMESRVRELALLNLGVDSKLRGCDLVALKVRDVCHGDQVATRAVVLQHKTQRPVQFEITQAARDAVQAWIRQAALKPADYLFPSRLHDSPHLGTRQYARIRYEVIERCARNLRMKTLLPGVDLVAAALEIRTQLRCAIETIENDVSSRGAQNFDRASILDLFVDEKDQRDLGDALVSWDAARARLLASDPEPDLATIQAVLADMREMNYMFMRLATGRLHDMVQAAWKPPTARTACSSGPRE